MPPGLVHLQRFVSTAVRERGSRYFGQRRVSIQSMDEEVRAVVAGSRPYPVALRRIDSRIEVCCSCEHFERDFVPCKHIWATLLSVAERNPPFLENSDALDAVDDLLPDDDDDDEIFDILDARDANAFYHPSIVVPFRRRLPWMEFFESLQSHARFRPVRTHTPLPHRIDYVIVGPSNRVMIDTYGRSLKKNGELGAPKRVRLSEEMLGRLEEADREIAALISSDFGEGFVANAKLPFLFPRLAATRRLFYLGASKDYVGPLDYDERVYEFVAGIERRDKAYVVGGNVTSGDHSIPVDEIEHFVGNQWFVHRRRLARIATDAAPWIEALRRHGRVSVPLSAANELADQLAAAPAVRIAVPPELALIDITPQPKLRLASQFPNDSWRASVRFLYGESEIDPSVREAGTRAGVRIRRQRELEDSFLEMLLQEGFRSYSGLHAGVFFLPARQLLPAVTRLIAQGWEVAMDDEPLLGDGELDLQISTGIDWFDLEGGVTFGERSAALPQLLEAVARNETFVPLTGGGFGLIDASVRERLLDIASGQREGQAVRFKRNQVMLIDAVLASRSEVKADRDFAKLRDSIQRAGGAESRQEPTGFGAELRPYQRIGLGWLWFLRESGFGGVLADDMGLGKTVQALALLESLRQEKIGRPSLIVAPRSLMFNWKAEAARFAPKLRVLDHHGVDRLKGSEHFGDFDIILTTYATLQRDLPHLAAADLEYVILDEAQAIKNAASQSAKAVRALRSRHRLALSGTPIENHLGELWSLFEFLNPGMLGSSKAFGKTFGGRNAAPEQREKLARIVRPFVLRRTKQSVALELPEKDEQTLWVELSEVERRDYDELRDHYRKLLLDRVQRDGLAKSKMHILEALLRLRQAALHPALLDRKRQNEPSAKFEALEAELEVLAQGDHKALVFSQFTSLLDLLEPRLAKLELEYVRLDGRSRNREELVREFQERAGVRVFLISLKAGGVGLNLTAANYVYLLDPWWNPAVEAQAVDRAHRIGQSRRVTATRIVATDTVEEKIIELQKQKKTLADSIISADDGVLRKLDLADLEMLLS
jgi:superfamily II DNA or RNA helicase